MMSIIVLRVPVSMTLLLFSFMFGKEWKKDYGFQLFPFYITWWKYMS